ncbi:MAG: MBL fold metallo-hydrolase [Colwellia sp.]|nr:MBL fold metallo-hydrolase [Colwellia sp.]
MKFVVFFCVFFVMLGCTTANNVNKVAQAHSLVKYKNDLVTDKRFANIYSGKQSYPTTCRENCYPSSAVVTCETPAENCQFIGDNKSPSLATGISIRWLGHASFYITMPNGSSLLLDPVSQQFDWPVNWAFRLSAGFNRNEPLWPDKQKIAAVDAVLYSHIHYDHFNKDDIDKIGSNAEYFVPLGFAEHFPKQGFNINEMTWFSTKKSNGFDISFVPAHHFSSRTWVPYLYEDNDATLWGGWVIEQQGKRIFFAGDTGYSPHFKDIQQAYGDMDICLIPIASYYHKEHGNWYRNVHTTPEDALAAASELKCKVMIPWGYGNSSWKMGDHSSHSPLLRLLKMHKDQQSTIPLYILNEGEEVDL